MDRREAEQLYESGKDPTVDRLLELDRENRAQKEKIARLERDSQSSSKPPSSDLRRGRTEKKPQRKRSKRKAGGQPGHEGKKRELLPVEQVSDTIPCYAQECLRCRHFARCSAHPVGGEPSLRWQVTEIPPLNPTVTEYRVYTLCGRCGDMHRGTLPPEVCRSNFGPRLTAMAAYFTAVLHLPRRAVQECFKLVFGVSVALGSTQNLLTHTSQALAPIDEALKGALPQHPVINADESGWFRRWVWIFVTSGFVYFHIARSRGSDVLKTVLGEVYEGILCVDRWGAYTKYHKGLLQLCWAHLKRDILGIKEVGKKSGSRQACVFARRMEYLRKKLMALWYRYKTGKISRKRLVILTKPVRRGMEKCLHAFRTSSDPTVRSFARRLYKLRSHLFTFIMQEEVDPTNNISLYSGF